VKFKYLIIYFFIIHLYGFEGVDFYKKGEFDKAEQSFVKYYKKTNSIVAKAFLAKIYYKKAKYKKSKKIITELLNNDSVPSDIKEELKRYLSLINGKINYNTSVSAGILYDSNIDWNHSKTSDFAHIEEFIGQGSYLKNNFKTSLNFKLQNREYFKYPHANYVYINTNAFFTYYSLINSIFKIGYNANTTKSNHLYLNELYFFKKYNNYKIGIFFLRDYYKNGDYSSKNSGVGLRTMIIKNKFMTKLSLSYHYNNFKNNNLDNKNYKINLESNLNLFKFYIFMNYYYDLAKFNNYVKHIQYLNTSFNREITKHINYSIGLTKYYSLIHTSNNNVRKYEIYTKLIYNF
jgi:hypothetical protein